MKRIKLSIVVPCFNEEETLPETARRLDQFLTRLIDVGKIADSSSVIFIDDGSSDTTWQIIESLSSSSKRVEGLKLSRNQGHQNALLAGLLNAPGDAIVSIDADLQDDINTIEKMIDLCKSGSDIVYGVRNERSSDTAFKRITAQSYYKLLHFLGVDIVYNHADFRLMSRRAIEALREFEERNLFIRGIIPLLGFKSDKVYYERSERFAGESKYPLRKMLSLAFNGITAFSPAPLRYISLIGFFTSLASAIMILWVLWTKLFTEQALPGWASSVIPIYFIGGVQLLCIGIVGEYVAKLYSETKKRPRYFIEKAHFNESNSSQVEFSKNKSNEY